MKFGVCFGLLAVAGAGVPALAQDSGSDRPGAYYAPMQEGKLAPARKRAAAKPAAPVVAKPVAIAAKSAPEKPEPRDALADVPASQRAAIRAALLWSAGEEAAAAAGEDPMVAAIKSYQKRNKSKVTGALTPAEREALIAAAKTHDDEFGWNVMVDPATGIRIGIPAKLAPNARQAKYGTLWTSRHGDVQIETFRIATTDNLAALFERLKKDPTTRKVEYSVMRADNFIISGLQGLKKFAVRAQLKGGELRGFTMLYDQMMEGIVAPVMVAMASAFAPFPGGGAPYAVLPKSVEYGTGLIVSANGYIVTDRKNAEDCRVILANGLGSAEPIEIDNASGLALLRVYGHRNLTPVKLAPGGAKSGDLTLIGVPDPNTQDGKTNLSELKARLYDGSAIQLRQSMPVAGFSGAAAIDPQGRVVGMMETRGAMLASAEPSLPPVRLISAETIRDFLARRHVKMPDSGDV